ncbi:MAG: Rrf2 family transcriptional regulator [Thermovirgaceae bacterium]|nr:Rrf2 family transcriptional regulator [Thermovirgaceae bacterium]
MKNIIQISEASSLALHGVSLLAANRRRMSIREIAAATGASEAHLSKVFQRLVKEGMIRSIRGPGGGFDLAKTPESITLLDIYSAIEGMPSSDTCFLHSGSCPFRGCIFGDLIEDLTERVLRYLGDTTLADMHGKDETPTGTK